LEVSSFREIQDEFLRRVHSIVWCSFATIDRQGRPRSRILHAIWDESPTAWILTLHNTLKARHMENHPYVSLAYVADITKPVYADCRAEWVDEVGEKQRIWDMFKAAPAPLGYDPAPIFKSPDDPDLGLLKLTPWRIEIRDVPGERYVWHPASAE
jgi:general stress protein 26